MSKLIFLDIDGVINNRESMRGRGGVFRVHEPCVRRLNTIIDATGALCVLSSSWRINWPLLALQQFLEGRGFTGQLVDKTPYLPSEPRGLEISAYLNQSRERGYSVRHFVILDDDGDMGSMKPWLVQTKTELGLMPEDVDKAIYTLGV